MPRLNRQYRVLDNSGRDWGCVVFERQTDNVVHGRLDATPEFKSVMPIFARLDNEVTDPKQPSGLTDEISDEIAALGVTLEDSVTGQSVSAGIVVVTLDSLLLSCDASDNDA